MSTQYELLGERRFAPLFWTQFLGAANDNLFKFAFTLLATYHAARVGRRRSDDRGLRDRRRSSSRRSSSSRRPRASSPTRSRRARLMRFVKNLEIVIMAIAAFGFATQHAAALYLCVFLMGLHSTLFGPVKYAYLPQHLVESGAHRRQRPGRDGHVRRDPARHDGGRHPRERGGERGRDVAWRVRRRSRCSGAIAAQFVPRSPAPEPGLAINWNPFTETWRNLQARRARPRGVPLAARHLVAVVLRLDLPHLVHAVRARRCWAATRTW